MSRIGKEPIPIPPKVEVKIDQLPVHSMLGPVMCMKAQP